MPAKKETPEHFLFVQQIKNTMLEFLGRNVLGLYAWTKLSPEDKERTRDAVISAMREIVIGDIKTQQKKATAVRKAKAEEAAEK